MSLQSTAITGLILHGRYTRIARNAPGGSCLIEDLLRIQRKKSILDMVGVRPSRQRALPTFGLGFIFSQQSFQSCPSDVMCFQFHPRQG